MAKPWEKYQSVQPAPQRQAASGGGAPWEKYKPVSEPKSIGGFLAKAAKPISEPSIGDGLSALGEGLLENVAAPVGQFVDTYTGAPSRAALKETFTGSLTEGGEFNPLKTSPIKGIQKFAEQFGEDPLQAPTGKELATDMGFYTDRSLSDALPNLYSDTGGELLKFKRGGLLDPTPAGAAGLGLDIAADPTNVIPLGLIGKGAGKAAKAGAKGLIKGAGAIARGGTAVADAAMGSNIAGAASKAGDIASSALKSVSNIATSAFKPKVASTYSKDLATAAKLGLNADDLTAATQFGSRSLPSYVDRSIMETAGGGDKLEKYTQAVNKMSDGIENAVRNYGGGEALDPLTAGENLVSNFAEAERNLLGRQHITYKKAADLSPAMMVPPKAYKELDSALAGARKRAIGLTKGATKAQIEIGNDLLQFTDRLKKTLDNPRGNYRGLANTIGYIGDAMTDPNLSRAHAKELRNIYNSVKDSLLETVGDISPDLRTQLDANNKEMTAFFRSRDALGKGITEGKGNPEGLFKSVTKDGRKIDEFKKIASPDQFKAFRGAYLDSLLSRNSQGGMHFETSIKNLEKNKQRLLKMFAPQEIAEIEDILSLGVRTGSDRLSSALTSAGMSFKDIPKSIVSGEMGKLYLDRLKKGGGLLPEGNASKGLLNAEAAPQGLLSAEVDPTAALNQAKGLLGAKRGSFDRRMKGAQSIAPQGYEEQRRER